MGFFSRQPKPPADKELRDHLVKNIVTSFGYLSLAFNKLTSDSEDSAFPIAKMYLSQATLPVEAAMNDWPEGKNILNHLLSALEKASLFVDAGSDLLRFADVVDTYSYQDKKQYQKLVLRQRELAESSDRELKVALQKLMSTLRISEKELDTLMTQFLNSFAD